MKRIILASVLALLSGASAWAGSSCFEFDLMKETKSQWQGIQLEFPGKFTQKESFQLRIVSRNFLGKHWSGFFTCARLEKAGDLSCYGTDDRGSFRVRKSKEAVELTLSEALSVGYEDDEAEIVPVKKVSIKGKPLSCKKLPLEEKEYCEDCR